VSDTVLPVTIFQVQTISRVFRVFHVCGHFDFSYESTSKELLTADWLDYDGNCGWGRGQTTWTAVSVRTLSVTAAGVKPAVGMNEQTSTTKTTCRESPTQWRKNASHIKQCDSDSNSVLVPGTNVTLWQENS